MAAALREQGVEVVPVKVPGGLRRSWQDWRTISAAVKRERPDFVQIQYPMHYFGYSLAPAMASLRWRAVVMLHEAVSWGRQMPVVMGPVTLRARRVFVSSEFERAGIGRWMPWTRGKTDVVPIASNVTVSEPRERVPLRVVTFASVRPWRGIEEFVAFAAEVQRQGLPWEVRLIGDNGMLHYREFSAEMIRRGEAAGVVFTGRLPEEEVARELAEAAVAYFPFPEGAGERHGSLLSAFENGLPVVSTVKERTSAELAACIAVCDGSPADGVRVVGELLADAPRREALAAAGRAFVSGMTWPKVAALHVAAYERLLAKR